MFSFDEVILALDNAISLKTLKNWANKIEKLTDVRFVRQYAKNKQGRNYSYKVFSGNQIEQFNELVQLRKQNVPLEQAMIEVFMSAEEKERQQVISIAKKEFEENQMSVKELVEYTKEVLTENAEIKKRLKALELKMEMLVN
ncbi:TPA: hypothetical protein ACGY62_001471 [Enterococcus faecalis]|uniref:hypothetical protein n=1 Tax=Enterococcus faecalis TaxID=1351 RepID=UPI000353D1CB|nr:hypothetical protein [Enterococcus faecalis]EGO5193023.1 hypothetical protein [Enterococcus faecalis]EPH74733.1 hypothetical protein D929_01075 [Enterococcus faecalis 02-MB-P-10]RTK40980.1 hypothetical protein DRJ89_05575 [Enterococcus faecalis]WBY27563.1 hypothetical protein PE069_05825 [Enterococcus faecalis]WHT29880.1 hypothetical protein OGM83_03495 [Enterococcus faecalis]